MKRIIYTIISLTILTSLIFPQEKDSLIQLYYGMGDTIDVIDREIFEFYEDIDGYKYAQLFLRDRKYLISKITYSNNGIINDTVLVESMSKLYKFKKNMSRFKIENESKFESPVDASVFTNAGNNYDGKLEMFSKKYLYLNSDLNYVSGNSSPFNFKIPITRLDSLMVPVKQSVGPYLIYGSAGGYILGFIVGLATFDDDWGLKKELKWFISGAIGAGVGLLLGWLIGESIPPDILTIKFNSPYDVAKLRDHTAYYYRYDKALGEKYIEIE